MGISTIQQILGDQILQMTVHYATVTENTLYEKWKNTEDLDAVRVSFGVCFKLSKLPCKQQMNHYLNCASFCTTTENIPEYEEEIEKVK